MSTVHSLLNEETYYGAEFLARPVSVLKHCELVTVPSDLTVDESLDVIRRSGSPVLLVRDGDDSIEGVVTEESLNQVSGNATGPDTYRLSHLVQRNIAIEPESVSIDDLMARLCGNQTQFAVIVDRLGRPQYVVSHDSLQKSLNKLFQ